MLAKLLIVAVGATLLGVGGVVLYTEVVRDDAEPIGFRETSTAVSLAVTDETDAPPGAAVPIEGTWSVGSGTEVGYFTTEDFVGGLSDASAVGSTPAVAGTLDIVGTAVTGGSFTADLTELTSGEDRRDDRAQQVLQTDQFPTATFVLTAPIDLGETPQPETVLVVAATGELTVRDVTLAVSFDVEAKLTSAGEIEIVGAIPTRWSDYGVENPSNPFVSVRDEGEIQFRLVLTPPTFRGAGG